MSDKYMRSTEIQLVANLPTSTFNCWYFYPMLSTVNLTLAIISVLAPNTLAPVCTSQEICFWTLFNTWKVSLKRKINLIWTNQAIRREKLLVWKQEWSWSASLMEVKKLNLIVQEEFLPYLIINSFDYSERQEITAIKVLASMKLTVLTERQEPIHEMENYWCCRLRAKYKNEYP